MPDIHRPRLHSNAGGAITCEHSSLQNFSEPEMATPWSTVQFSTVSEKFVLPEHQRPTVKHDEYRDLDIPVIDLAPYFEGQRAALQTIIAQVKDSCSNWKFFHVVNHGVDEARLSRIEHQPQQFFKLPR